MTFKAGPRLQFLFHSDSSNNEWGYKFTVTAYGLPDVAVSWGLDLQLLVSRLMGRLASQCMALKSVHRKSSNCPFSPCYSHTEEQSGTPSRKMSPRGGRAKGLIKFPFSFLAAAAAKPLQSCPTLCDPIDGSPPGSHAPEILQARTLECVAVSFSNA